MLENYTNMNYTLEEHFKKFGEKYDQVQEVYSIWILLKKDISEKLNNVHRVFPYFSKHDASHSRTIITNIELFLGEQRIKRLSATDTFMLLICAYSHDLGMALELEEILEILEDHDGKFKGHLKEKKNDDASAERLLMFYDKKISDGNLKELYHSITLMLQEYSRPTHWKGVEKIENDYNSLFLGRIKARFIKSIISICEIHGKNIDEIISLSTYSTGMFADVFHPRFIAAMIRLGDILDLDNNRFDKEFTKLANLTESNIPKLSKLHYLKHESITHFYIGPNHIDIEASCEGDDALAVARELYQWLHWLEDDCNYLKSEWDMIAPRDFGLAPRIRNKKILVDGTEYQHFVYNLKMELPHDRIFKLLAGSNVYDSRYTAFREIIQNAIDATLLQMWSDFYNSLSPEQQASDYTLLFASRCLSEKYINDYKIHINVIEDIKNNSVYVEMIDQGIGIDDEDLQYMCRIGENNICNPQRHQLILKMPDWLVPSGVFGIGLQSAFQLTDEIEFFTKKANRTPRHIKFSSYSSNKGKIEVSKCPNSFKEQFEKLSTQGTLVKIKIKSQIFNDKDGLDYFDLDFDQDTINTHVIRVEIINQLKKYFISNPKNYFPVTFSDYKVLENGEKEYSLGKEVKNKIWYNKDFYETLCSKSPFLISNNNRNIDVDLVAKKLRYWNKSTNLFLTIDIPKCKIINDTDKIVSLQYMNNSFSIKYKYNTIIDYKQLFEKCDDILYSKEIELCKNLFKCSVDILDKNTEDYLNIDRNILKYDSIKYSDIVRLEQELFTELCNQMINENIEVKCFEVLEYLPIVTIIFSRFIDNDILKNFIEKFKEKLSLITIKIGSLETNIPLLNFLGNNNGISILYTEEAQNKKNDELDNSNDNDIGNYILYDKFFEIFPKHIFVPTSIVLKESNQSNDMIYSCKIKNEYGTEKISIDNKCWEKDCKLLYTSGKNELIKTALKPRDKYSKLFVNKLPKSFHKSKVFRNALDDNISTYIISPFDDITANKLIVYKNTTESLETHIKNMLESLKESVHFKKCIKYVFNNTSNIGSGVTEEEIKETYFELVTDIVNMFYTFKTL